MIREDTEICQITLKLIFCCNICNWSGSLVCLSIKDLEILDKFRLNSVYRKFFIYVHKNLIAPQTSDLLEKLALVFLYNFHGDHMLLTLKIKKLSPKTNVKNIKPRV